MTALFVVVTAFLVVRLTGIAINLRAFPVLGTAAERTRATGVPSAPAASRPTTRAAPSPTVSILVPARDEAANLAAHLPGLLRQDALEVLVLDDGSQDDTAAVARRLAGSDARVRVLAGAPLPPGWSGKNWACHQLAAAARGDVLLFTDADVAWEDGAVAASIREMQRQRADVFSVFPHQRTGSLGERVLVPLIDDVLLSFLPFPLLRLPLPAASTANGQAIAVTRSAYDDLGGHAAMRDEIVEDVRFARHARSEGKRLGLALGGSMVRARMYRGYREAVRGFAKSMPAAHGGSRALLLGGAALHVLVYTLPLLLVAWQPRWLAPLLLAMLGRLLVNAKTGRGAFAEALLVPVTPLLALPVYLRSLRRAVVWKGRAYA